MSRLGYASGESSDRGPGTADYADRGTAPFDDDGSMSVSLLERIVDICTEFEDLWHSGEDPRIEDYLRRAREPERSELLAALLGVELELRLRSGEASELAGYLARFPEDAARVRDVFERARDDAGRTVSEPRSDHARSGRSLSSQSRPGGGRDRDGVAGSSGATDVSPHARRDGGWGADDEPGTSESGDRNGAGDRDRQARHDIPTLSGINSADLTFVLAQAEVHDAVDDQLFAGAEGDARERDDERDGDSPAPPRGPGRKTPPTTYGPPAQKTGRFTLLQLIDSGMFGDVYLARDDVLHRKVALKFPRMGVSISSARVEAFLIEARNAAQLRHDGIVMVYDVVERKGVGGIFVVMEYVNGSTLRDLLKIERFPAERVAAVIAPVADAAHYAHSKGFIHRDLKPANILIDDQGWPHIADFGLAVHEQALGDHAGEVAGTIPYMAPEQVRGASHRLDGRTDIWALGVILYEMLTGSRPFPTVRVRAFDEILYRGPRPPREVEPSVPAELERICMKCLSKRMGERYASAAELADDLRRWLSGRLPSTFGPGGGSGPGWPNGTDSGSGEIASGRASAWSRLAHSGPERARIVPKGLRPFSPEDAPFFLDLMPGPRDRNGIPECARFWKTRIDSTDREAAFNVGLIYGPSGGGKSSLVQAGILPRLAPHVLTVSISTTLDGAEAELLRRVRQRCPGLPGSLGLAESIRALREGDALPAGKKLLIVFDQFEQWLQANGDRDDSALVEALRQCDGARVQALLLVRDDFWTALNRFLRNLEVELSSERNMAAVDLFDRRHARAVLAAFGRGHGALPDDPDAIGEEEDRFLDQAIEGLAEGGRVVCVRLALLAEMVKDRPWTPSTLDEIGGIRGVGIAFLENAIGSRAQHPILRPNRAAARAVLEALLPPAGLEIKGRVRSARELVEAAGYTDRRRDFEAVLRVLDGELRLITPTEPDGDLDDDLDLPAVPEDRDTHYQLTHDYLVPSIRDWLERRKRETRRGRARVRLEVLTAIWTERPQPRYLPSFLEWLSIRRHTLPSEWTPGERAMMAAATARLWWKGLAATAVLSVLAGLEMRHHRDFDAEEGLRHADIAAVRALPAELDGLRPYMSRLRPELDRRASDGRTPPEKRLVAALALLAEKMPLGPAGAEFLRDRILSTNPEELAMIRGRIRASGDRDALVEPLWNVIRNPRESPRRLVRAAALLAGVSPKDPRWSAPGPAASSPRENVARALKLEEDTPAAEWTRLLAQGFGAPDLIRIEP